MSGSGERKSERDFGENEAAKERRGEEEEAKELQQVHNLKVQSNDSGDSEAELSDEGEEGEDEEETPNSEENRLDVDDSSAAANNFTRSIDIAELQSEGIVDEEDFLDHHILEEFLYFYDKHQICKETFKKVLTHMMEKSKMFCWILVVPECYNKLMKEMLALPRDTCRRLLALNDLSEVQEELLQHSRNEIRQVETEVAQTIDKFIARLNGVFDNLSVELNKKYINVYWMMRSICLKIKADLQRYVAETVTGDEKYQLGCLASETYVEADKGFKNIPGYIKNPYYLSNVLNHAVNTVDILKNLDLGIQMVKDAFHQSFSKMENQDFLNTFTCNIVQLLRDNYDTWYLHKLELEGGDVVTGNDELNPDSEMRN